jgi:hypothetical protein
MTTKKTLRVPVAADGVPFVMQSQRPERTREIANDEPVGPENEPKAEAAPGAPREALADDVTVPVRSSIESSLTFEVLRRQSTNNDDEGDKKR